MSSKLDSTLARPLTVDELRRYIDQNSLDLRLLSLAEFRLWLAARLAEAEHQESYRLRCWIRDVKTAHRRRLKDRQRRLEEAQRIYEQSAAAVEFEQSQRAVDSLTKGVAGLRAAVAEERASPDKLLQFEQRLTSAEQRLAAAHSQLSTPEWKRLERARDSLQRLREEIGLAAAEATLEQCGGEQGNASTSAGTRLESLSSRAAREFIIPSLGLHNQDTVILHGATLECPRGELDQVVITLRDSGLAMVHAVVEAKSNINDLAHGFRVRQENLAWFVGDPTGFDAKLYRTDRFRDGLFKGHTVEHHEAGVSYRFDQSSFDLFRQVDHPPHRLDRLFFVTEHRPLLGLDSGDLSRLLYRVATDHRFDMQSDTKLRRLRAWLLDSIEPVQSIDVLKNYQRDPALANHILMTDHP